MKALALALLQLYKLLISPLLPPSCRFFPTCSEYTAEAISRYGIWKGSLQGMRRLLHCHPFNPGGYDPVK